jgi:hypothetical protein
LELVDENGEPFPLDEQPGRRALAGETAERPVGYWWQGHRRRPLVDRQRDADPGCGRREHKLGLTRSSSVPPISIFGIRRPQTRDAFDDAGMDTHSVRPSLATRRRSRHGAAVMRASTPAANAYAAVDRLAAVGDGQQADRRR